MIEALGITKRYGDVAVVDDLSFVAGAGEVVGFLGPNGAGKTTTMRILTGFLPATDGTARIAGHDIHEDSLEARRALGYLPESPPLYPEMDVRGFLSYVSKLKDVPRDARTAHASCNRSSLRASATAPDLKRAPRCSSASSR